VYLTTTANGGTNARFRGKIGGFSPHFVVFSVLMIGINMLKIHQ
jgi:hypothetical protein